MDYFFLGDAELVTAFRFIGIEGIAVKDADESRAVFRRITEGWDETTGQVMPDFSHGTGSCRILIITEEVADWLDELLIDWQIKGVYPLIVEIPGIMGKIAGRKTLVDSIREAIGLHV